jgi:hypothetical protein
LVRHNSFDELINLSVEGKIKEKRKQIDQVRVIVGIEFSYIEYESCDRPLEIVPPPQ